MFPLFYWNSDGLSNVVRYNRVFVIAGFHCISWPPILELKKSFSYFWFRIFLKNLSFIFRIFFKVHYGYTKIVLNFFWSQFLTYVKVEGYFLDRFLSCNSTLTYTWVNTVCVFFLLLFCWQVIYQKSQIMREWCTIFLRKKFYLLHWLNLQSFFGFNRKLSLFNLKTLERKLFSLPPNKWKEGKQFNFEQLYIFSKPNYSISHYPRIIPEALREDMWNTCCDVFMHATSFTPLWLDLMIFSLSTPVFPLP